MFTAILVFFGFFMVLSGVGYIDQAPLTLTDTLIGFGVSLIGIALWGVALLHIHYMGVSNGHR